MNNEPSTDNSSSFAPGWPGIEARWTSSAKDGIGTALGSEIRIWYALSHGIINEVYYPRIDQACTRDLQFIVTDGVDFFSEEKRDTETSTEVVEAGVPLFRVTNRCRSGRYVLVKEVFADPGRDCLVQRIGRRRSVWRMRSGTLRTARGSCPSRCGTGRNCRSGSCGWAGRLVPRCPWSGLMRSF